MTQDELVTSYESLAVQMFPGNGDDGGAIERVLKTPVIGFAEVDAST